MTEHINRILKTSALVLTGSFLLLNCEPEADELGSQFFDETAAKGVSKSYDVIAYNISNNDTIRTDATRITNPTLGAYKEGQFGMMRSSFVTQGRLSSYDPQFGSNAEIDSVVLEIKPVFPVDSVTTRTEEDYVFPDGNVAAKRVISTYPINLYGNESATMTINVHEVNEFLGSTSNTVTSDRQVALGSFLGKKEIKGTVSGIEVTKDEDNTALFKREPRLRIPLDKTYFENKIFAKQGAIELSDASHFIRYFHGVRISVAEDNGFIMNFSPDETQIVIYYKSDLTSEGTTTRTARTFPITLGTDNARFNQIETDRTGTPSLAYNVSQSPNVVSGDPLLYAQGMGGANVGIRFTDASIAELRDLYKNNKINIISAKVRLYTDSDSWSNSLDKPSTFSASYYNASTGKANLSTFLKEISAFSGLGAAFNLVQGTDLEKNPSYYDLTVTETLKEMIESSAENSDISLAVGAYEISGSTGGFLGPSYTTRAYSPNRVVLIGTQSGNDKRAQLNIVYATK